MNDPRVTRIVIYPIKSLDGLDVASARVSAGGALEGDRRWAMVDPADGGIINGKREPRIHALRARFEGELARHVTLARDGVPAATFDLDRQPRDAEAWLSDALGRPVTLRRDDTLGFPDDRKSWGPTILGAATLAEVATWIPDVPRAGLWDRFRANIEIGGVAALWEDRLFGAPGQSVRFRVGGVELCGINPCARCVVPSRDPRSGEIHAGFQKRLADHRQAALPPWAARERFDHFYRLAVNTTIAPTQAGRTIALGDAVTILD